MLYGGIQHGAIQYGNYDAIRSNTHRAILYDVISHPTRHTIQTYSTFAG